MFLQKVIGRMKKVIDLRRGVGIAYGESKNEDARVLAHEAMQRERLLARVRAMDTELDNMARRRGGRN